MKRMREMIRPSTRAGTPSTIPRHEERAAMTTKIVTKGYRVARRGSAAQRTATATPRPAAAMSTSEADGHRVIGRGSGLMKGGAERGVGADYCGRSLPGH